MFSVGSSGEWSEQFVNKFDDIDDSVIDTRDKDIQGRGGARERTQNNEMAVQSVAEKGEKMVENCEVVVKGHHIKCNRAKSAWGGDSAQDEDEPVQSGTDTVSKQFCTINSADT